jgi:hypothetical protein
LLTEKLLKDLHRIARNEQRHLHAIAGEC